MSLSHYLPSTSIDPRQPLISLSIGTDAEYPYASKVCLTWDPFISHGLASTHPMQLKGWEDSSCKLKGVQPCCWTVPHLYQKKVLSGQAYANGLNALTHSSSCHPQALVIEPPVSLAEYAGSALHVTISVKPGVPNKDAGLQFRPPPIFTF